MIESPRDKTGDRYEHFTCSGRRRKTTNCTRSAILAERAEAEIERTYQRNSLSRTQAEHVRKVLNDVFYQLEGSSEDERKLLPAQRDKLEAERLKLVQAHYADAIPSTSSRTSKSASAPISTRSPHGSTTSPTPTPRPEQAWTSSPNSSSTSTTSTTSANQPNDASSTAPCSPASPSTTKRTPPTPRRDYRQRPCPRQHRRSGPHHRRNKTAPPSGGASFDLLILRGPNGRVFETCPAPDRCGRESPGDSEAYISTAASETPRQSGVSTARSGPS